MSARAIGVTAVITRARQWFSALGLVAIGASCASQGMYLWALARGVHCLACQRPALGASLPWWTGYFVLLGWLNAAGLLLAVLSTAFARRRRYGVAAVTVWVLLELLVPHYK